MATVYKVQRGRLFSSGELRPRWSRQGKLFSTKQGLLNHLALVDQNCIKHSLSWPYHECKLKILTRYITHKAIQDLDDFYTRGQHGLLRDVHMDRAVLRDVTPWGEED